MKNSLAALVFVATFCCSAESDYEKYGGMVKISGKGFVAAIDCRVNGNPLDYAAGKKAVTDTFPIDLRDKKGVSFSLKDAPVLLSKSGGNCAVFIIDDQDYPMSLTASEEKWAMINAAKIKEDAPTKDRLNRRMSLLFARQAFQMLGAAESKSVDTCLHTVFKAADLDEITSYDLPMGPEMAIPETMTLRGIEKIEYSTYEEACELGVAAKPTNAIQKAIWEKVHAPPKTPLRIKFDPATQKGKVTK